MLHALAVGAAFASVAIVVMLIVVVCAIRLGDDGYGDDCDAEGIPFNMVGPRDDRPDVINMYRAEVVPLAERNAAYGQYRCNDPECKLCAWRDVP